MRRNTPFSELPLLTGEKYERFFLFFGKPIDCKYLIETSNHLFTHIGLELTQTCEMFKK